MKKKMKMKRIYIKLPIQILKIQRKEIIIHEDKEKCIFRINILLSNVFMPACISAVL